MGCQGELIDQGAFDHGKKTGEWTSYNPDGTVKRTYHAPAQDVVTVVTRPR